MFKGTVELRAVIKGSRLIFPRLVIEPEDDGVEKVEIESQDGKRIGATVHISSVASKEAGLALATREIARIVDRLSHYYEAIIADPRVIGSRFRPIETAPGVVGEIVARSAVVGGVADVCLSPNPARLKEELEAVEQPGERFYGLLRSAIRSGSDVEHFLHLYHLMMLVLGSDKQKAVDDFIRRHEPGVEESLQPPVRNRPNLQPVMETVYSRLRNEFAHARTGVDLETVKAGMTRHVFALRGLVKQAIRESS